MEPVSPELGSSFFTTKPPGKPSVELCYLVFVSFCSLSREVQTCLKFFCSDPKHVTYKNVSL